MRKEAYKFLKNERGEILFFKRKIYNKGDKEKWENSLKTLIRKKDIQDAGEEIFIEKSELKLSHLQIVEKSEIKIYENKYIKFIKISDSQNIQFQVYEKVLQEIIDKNGTKYILIQKGE